MKIDPKPGADRILVFVSSSRSRAPTKSEGLRGQFNTAKIYSAAAVVVALAASGAD